VCVCVCFVSWVYVRMCVSLYVTDVCVYMRVLAVAEIPPGLYTWCMCMCMCLCVRGPDGGVSVFSSTKRRHLCHSYESACRSCFKCACAIMCNNHAEPALDHKKARSSLYAGMELVQYGQILPSLF
jgi:hypothetical protein